MNKEKIYYSPLMLHEKDAKRFYYRAAMKKESDIIPGKPHYFIEIFPSVTQITSILNDWEMLMQFAASKGNEYNQFMIEKKTYGSCLHLLIAEYCRTEKLDYGSVPSIIDGYLTEKNIDIDYNKWLRGSYMNIYADFESLAQFVDDHVKKVLYVEKTMCALALSGTMDLCAEIEIQEKGFYGEVYKSGANKGKPKETKQSVTKTAIIDFKSGPSIYEQPYGMQLYLYGILAFEYLEVSAEKYFIVSPKTWRTLPASYNMRDMTDSISKNEDIFKSAYNLFFQRYTEPSQMRIRKNERIKGNIGFEIKEINSYLFDLPKTQKAIENLKIKAENDNGK